MKHDLPSGAVLDITLLPYGEAWDIASAVVKELKEVELNLPSDLDFADSAKVTQYLLGHIRDIQSPLCSILSSKKILESAHACLKKCTYDNARINGQTFESLEGRKDFLIACFYALKENISPFFEGLVSSFSAS